MVAGDEVPEIGAVATVPLLDTNEQPFRFLMPDMVLEELHKMTVVPAARCKCQNQSPIRKLATST